MGVYVVGLVVGLIDEGAMVGREAVGAVEGPDGHTVGQLDGAIELGLVVGRNVGLVVGFAFGVVELVTDGM